MSTRLVFRQSPSSFQRRRRRRLVKATLQRYNQFINTPEVLERSVTFEKENEHIEDSIQSNEVVIPGETEGNVLRQYKIFSEVYGLNKGLVFSMFWRTIMQLCAKNKQMLMLDLWLLSLN